MICSNPACEHSGIDQPPENFPPRKRRCRTCCRKAYKAWREKNVEREKAYRKWIPDDDPEDDLRPVNSDGNWNVITAARKAAIVAHDTMEETPVEPDAIVGFKHGKDCTVKEATLGATGNRARETIIQRAIRGGVGKISGNTWANNLGYNEKRRGR